MKCKGKRKKLSNDDKKKLKKQIRKENKFYRKLFKYCEQTNTPCLIVND